MEKFSSSFKEQKCSCKVWLLLPGHYFTQKATPKELHATPLEKKLNADNFSMKRVILTQLLNAHENRP